MSFYTKKFSGVRINIIGTTISSQGATTASVDRPFAMLKQSSRRQLLVAIGGTRGTQTLYGIFKIPSGNLPRRTLVDLRA